MFLEAASYAHPVCALLTLYVFTDTMQLPTKINHCRRQVAVYLEGPQRLLPRSTSFLEKEPLRSHHLLSKLQTWARFCLGGRDTIRYSARASAQ